MADFALNIIADIEQYKRKIMEIGGITEDQATKMALAFGRQQTRMQMNAYRAALKAAQASGKAWEDAGKKTDALVRIGEKTIGGVVGDIQDIGESLAALGPAGAIAVGSVVGIGVAAAGASLLVGGLVVGFVELVRSADEAVKRIEELEGQELISQEQTDQVKRANAAFDAVSIVIDSFIAKVVADFGPTIEWAAIKLLNMGEKALNAFDSFTKGKDLIEEFAIGFALAIIDILSPVGKLLNGLTMMDLAIEKLTGRKTGVGEIAAEYHAWAREQAKVISGVDGLDEAQDGLNDRTSFGARLIDAILAKEEERQEKTKETTKTIREEHEIEFSDLESHLASVESAMSAHNERIDAEEQRLRDERQKREAEATAARIKLAEEEYARKRQLLEDWASASMEVADRLIQLGAERLDQELEQQTEAHEANISRLQQRLSSGKNLTKAERAEIRARIDAEKQAILEIAKAERKMAAFQILLQGGIALAKAVATAPPPLNAAAIAAQAALLAINTGAAATAPLPKVHTGTLGSIGLAPDEGLSVIRQGEVTLSQRAARQIGEVLDANRGGVSGGGGAVQRVYYDGRMMGEIVGRALEEPGAARRVLESRAPIRRGYRG